MHAHLCRRLAAVRILVLALLMPAVMALAVPPAHAQSYLLTTPTAFAGGWQENISQFAEGGIYFVTFNTQSVPSSAALWEVNLPQAGQYQVYVSSLPTFNIPRTMNAQYEISTASGTQIVSGVDQNFAGEKLLGTFTLNAGFNTIRLTDVTGEPQLSHTVVANAARWVLISGSPFPPPSGGPEILGYLDFYGNPITAAPPGTPVMIIGNGFGTSGSVAFAGHNATIVRWTPTDIRVLTPFTGSDPTVGPVTVTTGGNTITGPVFRIDSNAPQPQPAPQPAPGPIITGYAATNPRGVPIFSAPPGAPVLIEGQNLGSVTAVYFNGYLAALVSVSPTELLVTVPFAAPSTGPVTVVANGQSVTGPNFTITAPAPAPQSNWPMFMHDSRQTGLADAPLDPRGLSPWSVSIGGHPGTSPVVMGGVAYIGSDSGIYAIDIATRMQRWYHPGAPVRSAPAATAQAVFVSAGGLYALSPVDGSILWQRPDIVANSDVSPMLLSGTVYIGARGPSGPAMYAVSAANGVNVWPAPIALPGGSDVRSTAAASPDMGLLFVGLGPSPASAMPGVGLGAIAALHLTDGSLAWSGPALFPGPPTGISIGYAGSGAQPGPGGVLPALVQAAVFVASGPNVLAFSAFTGTPIWTRTLSNEAALQGPPVLSTAASTPSTLYVGGINTGRVYALNSLTGGDAPGGLLTPIAPITGTLALAGSVLFVPTSAGLVAADAPSGAPIWSSPFPAASGVAIAGGSPYVGTADGHLVGFSR